MKLKFKSITNPIARFSSLALMAGVCLSVLALRAEDCAHANKEHLSTQEPTCTEWGWLECDHCLDCGYYLPIKQGGSYYSPRRPPIHTHYGWPTETTPGVKTYTCSACHAQLISDVRGAEKFPIADGDKIIFFGDSLTEFGWQNDTGYCHRTIEVLSRLGLTIAGQGAGKVGDTSSDALARLKENKDNILKKQATGETYFTYLIGFNDVSPFHAGHLTVEEYIANVDETLNMVVEAGIKPVVIIFPGSVSDFPDSSMPDQKSHYSEQIPLVVELRNYAVGKGYPIVEAFDPLHAASKAYGGNWESITGDGAHMSVLGDAMLAKLIIEATTVTPHTAFEPDVTPVLPYLSSKYQSGVIPYPWTDLTGDVFKKNEGTYTVTATLADGAAWADGYQGKTRDIIWKIGTVKTANTWTTPASITKSTWVVGDDPGVVTVPVAEHNDNLKTTPTIAKDGGAATPWGSTMPTAVGSYVITWTVPETAEYTGLTTSLSFTITAQPTGEKFLDKLRADPHVISGTASPYATGGDLVLQDGNDYIHVFYNTAAAGTLSVTGAATADILVVGGGACGGSLAHNKGDIDSGAGGGGAGGVTTLNAAALAAGSYAVAVGAGGKWADAVNTYANGNGGTSSFGELATAHGGGIGGRYDTAANGGAKVACGGGGNGYSKGDAGGVTSYSGEGCKGGNGKGATYGGGGGGGGADADGGAGGVGATGAGGAGGAGRPCAILGGDFAAQIFGGGGGGASFRAAIGGAGGQGGGGAGGYLESGTAWAESCVGEAGEDGLGGGGGGGLGPNNTLSVDYPSGDGGSGIVIVRFKGAEGPTKIAIPTAKTGLVYTGEEQTGVEEGAGYTLTGNKETDANTYTATASLVDKSGNTKWSDDTTTDKSIEWTIAKGANAWRPVPSISSSKWPQGGKAGVLTPGGTKFGKVTATIAKNGDAPGPFSGTTLPKEVGEYVITYTAPAATANYTAPDETTKSVQFTIVEYEFTAIDPPYFSSARTFKSDGNEHKVTLAGFDEATMTKETESVESATDAGIYKVYVTPKDGYGWSDTKSAETRALEWGIVASGYVDDRNFLISLANSRNRVNATALPPGISGGDIVLRYENEAGLSYDFVHIYTNTAASGFVFNNDSGMARPGRVLIVGGGGASGFFAKAGAGTAKYVNSAGGGGGGAVKSILDLSLEGSYSITVGAGGKAVSKASGENGGSSSFSSWTALGGGGGGRSADTTAGGMSGRSCGTGGGAAGYSTSDAETVYGTPGTALSRDGYDGGESTYFEAWLSTFGGSGGGAGAKGPDGAGDKMHNTAISGGLGFYSDILTDEVCFGGGGCGGMLWNNGDRPNPPYVNSGGLGGGGGNTCSSGKVSPQSGVCGLGGGAGGPGGSKGSFNDTNGQRGGDGIVIVRYTDTVRAPKIKTVAVPEVPSFVFNYQVHDTGIRDTEDYTVSDDVTGLYIQEYTITLTLRDPDNMQWTDGTIQPQHIKWYIRSDKVETNSGADRFLYGLSTNHNRVATDQLQIGADMIMCTKKVIDSVEYLRYALVYTNTQNITIPQSFTGDMLIVGGGGGGGKARAHFAGAGGGGGAGGFLSLPGQALPAGDYTITVGKGGRNTGAGFGTDGSGSSVVGPGLSHSVAGGGGGGWNNQDGCSGASGGGACGIYPDDAGITYLQGGSANPGEGQGNAGGDTEFTGTANNTGAAAGGGGAGAQGGIGTGSYFGGVGGAGCASAILGWEEMFAGGGRGGSGASNYDGEQPGGAGGGGSSVPRKKDLQTDRKHGSNGQGGGGGGANGGMTDANSDGGNGGDGIVILAYEIEAGKMVEKPLLTVDRFTYSGETITAKDYLTSLEHIVVTGKDAAVNVGSYTFTVALEEGYLWTDGGNEPVSFEWMIVAKPIQGNVTVPAIPDQVYTGSPITPSFQVFDTARDVVLTPGTDYTAEYNGNVNIGTATIKLTGKGNYTGNEWTTFQIVANPDEQGYYVTPDATDGDGTGWESPTTLANALTLAQSSGKPVTIYALEGTYAISSPCTLANPGQDVRIMGGYTGTGLARGQNFSVLDGAGASALLSLTSDRAITLQRLQLRNSTAAVTKGGSGALTVTRCVFDSNTAAAALQVSAGSAAVENCTFAENAAGSVAQTGGAVTVRNSILWNSSRTAEVSGTVTLEYVLLPDDVAGTGIVHGDPLFVSDDDFHLKSTAGHYTPSGWVEDAVSSPAIDAGDPAADCSAEPKNAANQNFGLNLGVYGNTAHASKSPEVKLAYDLHAISIGGPLVRGIPTAWLEAAFPGIVEPTQAAYQAAFLTKNGNDVTAWAAYILGFAGEEVASAAIIEKATQSEMTEDGQNVALTIDLPDLPPESKRPTVAGCTVSYSLLTNTDANALREGNGTIVEGCEKIGKLPFSAPLDFTSGHAYYRIRVHFSFKGE